MTNQHTTAKNLIKSYAILIYYELKIYFKFNHTQSLKLTQEIFDKVFNEHTINMEEFNQQIYIQSFFNNKIVFGAKRGKNSHFAQNELLFIKNRFIKDFPIYVIYNQYIENFINNLHIQILRKYPLEFFRKNQKYSTLKSLF